MIISYDTIQSEMKVALGDHLDGTKACNKAVFALAKKLALQINFDHENVLREATETAKPVKHDTTVSFDDFKSLSPEELVAALAKILHYKVVNNEISASEIREMKDLFNLKAKDLDINIEQVDFRGVYADLAEVVKAVQWMIEDYNKDK